MNGIIVIDKPMDWTSQDVCSKLRGILREKRIGHGGTLDPMATGVLPVFCGRATRAAQFCENAVKSYTAGARFGITTDTQDITGNVLTSTFQNVTKEDILSVLPSFLGEQEQIPPMYSAVKIGGKKLYELARSGKTVERKPRHITIYSLDLMGEENGDFLLNVKCSKGTYVRTLVNDIGAALGCGGTMSYLRRTMAGNFTLSDAVTLEDVQNLATNGEVSKYIKPVDSLFSQYPSVTISGRELMLCLNGNEFKWDIEDGFYRVYSDEKGFLMLGQCQSGVMKTVKSFFEV
jgi:tRNA pseudouridine55 synthase